MHSRLAPILCLSIASSTIACDKVMKKVTREVTQEVGEGVNQAASTISDDERMTMGHYAAGFNTIIGDPQECLEEYFEKVPKEGPESGQKYTLFPEHTRAVSELKKATAEFEQAAKSAPEALRHLEPLAKSAVADLEKAIATFEEAHKYYDAENFKDDEGKKGKELHQSMLKASEAFSASIDKLESELSAVEERQAKEELKAFEADKGYSYQFRLFNFESNKLLKIAKPKEFSKAFTSLDTHYEQVKKFADSKGAEINDSFKAYMGQVDRYHSTAKKLSRELAADETDDRKVSQLRSQLVSAYNALVSTGNSLRQLEANNLLK